MTPPHRLWRYVAIPLALAGMLSISSAAELNPAAVIYKLPDQIQWSPVGPEGAQSAVLTGDPAKPGFYAIYIKWTPGDHFSRPHFHPNDRYIAVLKGTWWVGSGPKFDPANTVPMPAGSFRLEHHSAGNGCRTPRISNAGPHHHAGAGDLCCSGTARHCANSRTMRSNCRFAA